MAGRESVPRSGRPVPHVRVLIADDHPQVLSALVATIEADGRFSVVGTATNGHEAVRLAGELAPDVALLDVRMPAGGPPAVAAIAALLHAPRVVAISADANASTVADIVRAGAVGYLTKGRIGELLPDVLARCAQGEVILATPTGAEALRSLLTG